MGSHRRYVDKAKDEKYRSYMAVALHRLQRSIVALYGGERNSVYRAASGACQPSGPMTSSSRVQRRRRVHVGGWRWFKLQHLRDGIALTRHRRLYAGLYLSPQVVLDDSAFGNLQKIGRRASPHASTPASMAFGVSGGCYVTIRHIVAVENIAQNLRNQKEAALSCQVSLVCKVYD